MRKLKKSFITFFLLLLVIQAQIIVKAESKDITQTYEEYLHNYNSLVSNPLPLNNPIEINPRVVPYQKSFTVTFKNSIRVDTYTRSSSSSSVNLSVMVTSSRPYVDAALFDANSSEVKILGVARHLTSGQFNSVNWSTTELGNCTRFYLFLTTYTDASATVSGAITY